MEENTGKAGKKNRGNPQNLAPPFPKGVSGNPKGYPKGKKNRRTIYREMLECAALEALKKQAGAAGKGAKTVGEQLVACAVHAAASGDIAALKELMDSAYGKNTDKIESTTQIVQMPSVTVKSENADGGTTETTLSFNVGTPVDERRPDDV